MGPRSFERGNRLSSPSSRHLELPLQWGRAHSSAEIVRSKRQPWPPGKLQWGRAHSSAEISRLQVLDFQRAMGRFSSDSRCRPQKTACSSSHSEKPPQRQGFSRRERGLAFCRHRAARAAQRVSNPTYRLSSPLNTRANRRA